MKLRRRSARQASHSADEARSAKRRKRRKKDDEGVWYHNVAPIFEEPISDDFLGLVPPPDGEAHPYEEPSVQVTVERGLPPEAAPVSDPYVGAVEATAGSEADIGASGEFGSEPHDQAIGAPADEFGIMPAAETWAELGFPIGGPASSLDAPPWAMEPPAIPEAVPPPGVDAPPWAMEPPEVPEAAPPSPEPPPPALAEPAADHSVASEAPLDPAPPEPEWADPATAPPEPAPWQPEPSFESEPTLPAEPPAPQRPFVHDSEALPAVDPPMIIPIRAYYMTRADDTLRSVAAQFLNTPSRWQELRSLNAAYPGIANAGPDTLLPVGSSLALPGDPLPWGKPDPVYLWTLAEKFLYTAWGREPSPEEVVPFWRGLTSGAKHLDMGASAPPAIGASEPAEPPIPPAMQPPGAPPPEAAVTAPPVAPPPPVTPVAPAPPSPPPVAHQQETSPEEPPTAEPSPEYVPDPSEATPPAEDDAEAEQAHQQPLEPQEPPPAEPEQAESAALEPPEAVSPSDEPPAVAAEPDHAVTDEPPAPGYEEPETGYEEPAPGYEEPETEAPVDEQPAPPPPPEPSQPAYEEFVPAEAPAAAAEPDHAVADEPPAVAAESDHAVADVPPAPVYEEPETEAPVYEQPEVPAAAYEAPPPPPPPEPPQPVYEAPPPPPQPEPPQPVYQAPVPPEPPRYEPPTTPAPGFAPMPGMPDLGPIEPEAPAAAEMEAPPLPAFMPSLTGATPSAELPVEQVVASSQRALAGTAIGDAMMLWQLGRLRRRRGAKRGDTTPDPLELSLEQTARLDSLRLIEAAMRHLRAVTISQLKPKPRVVCVRTGAYGFEVLLDQPVEAPAGWQAASGGYVLELPRGVTVEQLDAAGQGPSLCPALVPVGDTAEGPLLLNIEEIGCLAVSGPSNPTASLLTSIVETLGSSPLAGDIRIITVGVSSPVGPGWERIHATSYDSPQLEHLLSTAHSPAHAAAGSIDVLVIGPGNDLLFQRAGQIASTPGSRLMLVGATSSAAARWPWRIHVDENSRAVVHPIAVDIVATQAMRPELAYLLSEAAEGPHTSSRF